MSSSESKSELVIELAEEFISRYRKGERPPLREYIDRHPELAAEIKEVFPAMAMMENIAVEDDSMADGHTSMVAKPAPVTLKQLGDYRIIREIGRGGMGFVYEAEQVSLGRHVALKLLPNHALHDDKQKRRFEREARAAAKLHHTNIVPVFGIGDHDGVPYYVMQFIQGLGLDAVLDELNRMQTGAAPTPTGLPTVGEIRVSRRDVSAADVARSLLTGEFQYSDVNDAQDDQRPASAFNETLDQPADGTPQDPVPSEVTGRLSDSFTVSSSSIALAGTSGTGRNASVKKQTYWHSVANIGRQVAEALEYAHQQGIQHRDVKPSNLLLDMRGTVWVTDFGLAKVAGPGADNLTHTGDILGTLRYMPPEAFEGKTDARSDVYALGLTLYELLAMRPAFNEKDRNKLIKQVTSGEPPPLNRVRREIPRDLVTIVQKSSAREPSRRYATAGELALDLQRFLDDEPILARRQTHLERYVRWARHNPGIATLGGVLTAVLVLVTLGSLVAAGYFNRLRLNETQAAQSEREARHEAELSREAESLQRQNAEIESRRADESARKAAKEAGAAVIAEQEARAAGKEAREAEERGRRLLYATDMQLAPFIWKDPQATAAQLRNRLDVHDPGKNLSLAGKHDLRGFEWHYYQNLLDRSAAVFPGHRVADADPSTPLAPWWKWQQAYGAFTSNGQLVTLDQNGQVRRWDLDSQHEDEASRRELPGGPGAQISVLAPNGRLAALAEGNKVHVFDTSTGEETLQIDSTEDRPRRLIISRDSDRRLIFSRDNDRMVIVDNKIRWYNAASGEEIASVDRRFAFVSSVALSADGLTVAIVGYDPSLLRGTYNHFSIFRLDTARRTVSPLATEVKALTISASALSPDGQWFGVGESLSGSLTVIDTATGRSIVRHDSAHASPVAAIAFSGDGAKLATADTQGTIKIWEDAQKLTSKSAPVRTLKGHHGAINTVGFSIDGKRLVSVGADKTARVWDLENAGAAVRPLERLGPGCLVARFSPDGQLIAAANGGSLRLWDAATGRLVRELSSGDKSHVFSVAFSPTDNRLLAVGYGGPANVSYVALWDIDAGTELAQLPGATDLPDFLLTGYTGVVGALSFSPDGKYLVAGFGLKYVYDSKSSPSPLKVWEVATRQPICRLNGHTGFCVSLNFSKDGTLLASGSRDGTAIIWSTETWKAMRTLQNPDRGTAANSQAGRRFFDDAAFSPDGKTLATASRGGNLQLWDVASGKLLESLKGHASALRAVVFSPDGRTLASASDDQTVRLWNVETRRELMQLDPGSIELGGVSTLAFSTDGKHLLAGGLNSTVLWSAAPMVWSDSERAAEKLRLLLQSNADFQSRTRMLSENLRLYEALEKLDRNDVRVKAAVAATRANWYASRKAWPEAVAAFDQLMAADPISPESWLRTPGLLRLATALLHQDRPRDAAALLAGGAKRRAQDGVPAALDQVAFGIVYSPDDGQVRVIELLAGSPAVRSGLIPGDVIVKVNDTELTRESRDRLPQLLGGNAGTKVRLTVRHSGSERLELIELTREQFVNDAATGELLHPLRAAINARLARDPGRSGLLELRAELAGQWSDAQTQLADYTAAIEALSQQTPEAAAVDLKRLYGRRGNAFASLEKWQEAVADFSHSFTKEATGDVVLPKRAHDRHEEHRYNAARAAALAAAGQGKDEPPLDEAAIMKLRRQALDWLRAELTTWEKLLESGPPQARLTIVQTMSRWQKDTDLAGIRDAEALAELPAEEQKAFDQLWADVAALLRKAEIPMKTTPDQP